MRSQRSQANGADPVELSRKACERAPGRPAAAERGLRVRRVVALILIGWFAAVGAVGAVGCSSHSAGTGDGASSPADPARDRTSSTAGFDPSGTAAPGPARSHLTVTSTPPSFAQTDAALESRVRGAGLTGGMVRVVRDGQVVHDAVVGDGGPDTPLSVASAAKWLTAATMMTFVDDGAVSLDDPVSRWLPEFAGEEPPITVRELLDHTSGLQDEPCIWDEAGDLAACVRLVASSPREFAPGTAFSYGNADFHVAGRLLEVLGRADFATVFERRIGTPLAMTSTTWPGAPDNPSPAAGARTTLDDYSHFLAMILARGDFQGSRILSTRAVDELVRNQIAGFDTSHDSAVAVTGIPRYALGAWPDVIDAAGTTTVISGNGAEGFYPWVDFVTNSYGVVAVQDDRGASVAVPASQAVAVAAREALTP
jgi:D-alanyl-D-alanine-carboxypeptidase/D-alanyl-D-alanine-endopeptidase